MSCDQRHCGRETRWQEREWKRKAGRSRKHKGFPLQKLFAVRALEGLQFTRPEQDILRDIRQGTKQPKEEPIARATQELQKSSTCSLQSAEWSEHDGLLYYRGSIYVPNTSDLRRRIVSLCHDTKVAGHPGRFKTLELVSRSYWWLNMSRYVGMYVSHCNLC